MLSLLSFGLFAGVTARPEAPSTLQAMAEKTAETHDEAGCYPILRTVARRRSCRLCTAGSFGRQSTPTPSNNPEVLAKRASKDAPNGRA